MRFFNKIKTGRGLKNWLDFRFYNFRQNIRSKEERIRTNIVRKRVVSQYLAKFSFSKGVVYEA